MYIYIFETTNQFGICTVNPTVKCEWHKPISPSLVKNQSSFGFSGWWYTYPSEKYDFVSGMIIPNWMESHKIHVPNHQPVLAEKPIGPMGAPPCKDSKYSLTAFLPIGLTWCGAASRCCIPGSFVQKHGGVREETLFGHQTKHFTVQQKKCA